MSWVKRLFARRRVYGDLSAEIREHLEEKVEELVAEGMPRKDAEAKARKEFGNVTLLEERGREVWQWPRLESFLADIRFGLRMLRKSPGFTAVAVVTLALGIGANTAIFSVVNAVLLRPLPYPNPEAIVLVVETVGKTEHNPVSYPNFLDWQRENRVFRSLAAYAESEVNLSSAGNSEHVPCEVVSASYFELLGVHAILGRTFVTNEAQTPGGQPMAVLGYGLWKRAFGGDAAVIGRSVQVNESEFTILGVLPPGFRGFSGQAAIWVPIQMRDVLWPETARFKLLQSRDVHWHRVIGRLKQGVTLNQAQDEMSAMGAQLAKAYPEANRDRGVAVLPARQSLVAGLRTPLLVLLGAVGCILLIACANVANLSLARAIARVHEMAVRVSLGASRARIVRQFLTESLLVALSGGILGALLAFWGLKALLLNLPVALPYYAEVKFDFSVLAFTTLATGITGLVLGSLPAWKASRVTPGESLKERAHNSGGRRQGRAAGTLIVIETSAVLLLMIGAGLLLRSFARMSQIAPGFRPDHLLTLRVHVPNHGYTSEQRRMLGQSLVETIEETPGVDSAAANTADPFVWDGISRAYTIEGRSSVPTSETDTVYYHEVNPGFFKTMGIPLESGRDFAPQDDMNAPPAIIVSRAFAQRYWPHQDPIGKHVKFGLFDSPQPWMSVIAVVGDYRYHDYLRNPEDTPVFYGALLQSQNVGEISLLVRTKTDPAAMTEPLRRTIEDFDPRIPVYSVATLDARLAEQFAKGRAAAYLVTLFALLSLVLGVVGIYGVMSYAVSQQTHDIGIRMALGAQRVDVLGDVLLKGMRLVALGIACGSLAALVVTHLMKTMLFGVSDTDPLTFSAVALLMIVVALAACYIPARRAMRVDPMVALRYE
ncbi:MAG TPA: ABC transporter permease [Candidatus Acidoferrales bacterium]|nr:ABC transporter permease [Candidatus Acidoferrales bacterium]